VSTFLLQGSGEFEPWTEETERRAIAEAPAGPVLVAPTASFPDGEAVYDRWAKMGLDHYAAMGVEAELLPLKTRKDAMRARLAERVAASSMVFFSGGKPQHLGAVLEDSPVLAALTDAMVRGTVFAGCSAGAMVASQSHDQRGGGATGWVFGLGLVPHVSFGVHWDRARFIPGMRPLVRAKVPRATWFVGIDERTAILGDGVRWEVFGLGGVEARHERGAQRYRAGETFATDPPTSSLVQRGEAP
jgi:cyanophycinase-like exopeptidase